MAKASITKQETTEQLQGEYISGGHFWSSPERLYLDDYNTDILGLNYAVRRKISRDSEYKSSLSLLADSVFSEGIEVVPAINDEENSEFTEAKEIAQFIAEACSDPVRPLETVLREMFKEAFTRRTKIAEIVLKPVDDN